MLETMVGVHLHAKMTTYRFILDWDSNIDAYKTNGKIRIALIWRVNTIVSRSTSEFDVILSS